MKAVIQRVTSAKVTIELQELAAIKQGFVILLGVARNDTIADCQYLAKKISKLRVFDDEQGKMNRSLHDVAGTILSVSQFTLLANTKKGNRPSFTQAAPPDTAKFLYQAFNEELRKQGCRVLTGEFGSFMNVSLINDGPLTIIIDSHQHKTPTKMP